MGDILLNIALTAAAGAAASFGLAYVKKGQFEEWGKKVGRTLSKIGNSKLGSKNWEKLEDTITLAFLSFAKGVKLGSDEDDNIDKTKRIEDKLNNSEKA